MDNAELIERLGMMYSHRGGRIPTQYVNPDGPAAAEAIKALQAEVERLKRMNADQDSLLDTRTDELEAAEAEAESYRIERQELGERLGCPPGIRLEQYLEARVRQAAEAESYRIALERIANPQAIARQFIAEAALAKQGGDDA